jgi:hypothetical protein
MWYLAEILFAEHRQADCHVYQCESCNVVFEAATAPDAYRKAVAWGQEYAAESLTRMRFLGISHLTSIGEELGDGVEICGRFFEAPDVWDRVAEFVPLPESLKAVVWEGNRHTPIGELLTPEQIAQLKRRWKS